MKCHQRHLIRLAGHILGVRVYSTVVTNALQAHRHVFVVCRGTEQTLPRSFRWAARLHAQRIGHYPSYIRHRLPHHGQPPWHGGGAYAPRTRRICNLEVRSQLTADHMVRTTILHVTSAKWLVNFRLQCRLWLHSWLMWALVMVTSGLCIGPNWYLLTYSCTCICIR